jgi:diguanylate cyclase (GGDEF)-like protein
MPKKVLIIDDSIPLHKLVRTYLAPERLKMYSAYDGEAALTSAASLRPGVILLDVDIPRVDGFEVCRRLRSNPATASIPVIFLTANTMLDQRVKGLDVGASDYICKPFKPAELRARVRAALRAKSELESANLIDGPTGLWNRTYLDGHMDYHVSLAKRFGASLACIMVEIDPAETSIGSHSEAAVAGALRTAARVFTGRCRVEDVICRFDENKFAILLTGADRAAAALVAERLRAEIARQLSLHNGRQTRITCSFGVADTIVADAATLLDRADAAACGARQGELNSEIAARGTPGAVNAVA